ncbi:unnamed protein product [Candida verbasci]|uniref:protein-serine/threonine phosphatase n=1 Tax=Candida verbasci TaxID=1227364 RepID=A0A9W4TRP1_9ASCO|nr:unnamed protein product [Candida verbasci]
MGNFLSHPIEEKEIDYKNYEKISYCIGSMQGYRLSMEDAHNVLINEDQSIIVFGVFDGHGGDQCSKYLAENLPKYIFKRLNHHHKSHKNQNPWSNPQNVIHLLKNSFFKLDHDLYSKQHQFDLINCGSTGIIIVIINSIIYVANTGDSRCIISIKGKPKTLSFDHKPNNMSERVRIENSNGYIINNRVNEILALSRAFGDFKFKLQFLQNTRNEYLQKNMNNLNKKLIHLPPELFQVTVEPDVLLYDYKVQNLPEFIVIACDGIWDCFKNGQLIQLIRDKLVLGWRLNKIVEHILNTSLSLSNHFTGVGYDNMTIIIIPIQVEGQSLDDWYKLMINRIANEKGLN